MDTLLVIYDELALCQTLEKVFTKEGYRVVWTTATSQVLELLSGENPSCVLLDLKLADVDGLTVLQTIQEHDRHIPVIILTAYETVKTAVVAMQGGAFHYLAKPFDNEDLLVLVRKAVEQHR